MLEKYYFEIKQYLDNIINDNFIQSLIDDFGNKIINNSLPDQTEYLKEIIDNFSIIYSNKTNIINEDIEYLTEKIEFLEYINYTKKVSINSYIQFIKSLLDNQIEIIYDLNENILNYIISNETQIENEINKTKEKFSDIKQMISNYKNKTNRTIAGTDFIY